MLIEKAKVPFLSALVAAMLLSESVAAQVTAPPASRPAAPAADTVKAGRFDSEYIVTLRFPHVENRAKLPA